MSDPFVLREIVTPRGPAGFPPDVAPGAIIYASHINAIRDSVGLWPGHVDAQGHNLISLGNVGIGTADLLAKLTVHTGAVSGSVTGLRIGADGSGFNCTADIVWAHSSHDPTSAYGRLECNYAVSPIASADFVFHLRPNGGVNGWNNPVMRITGEGNVGIGTAALQYEAAAPQRNLVVGPNTAVGDFGRMALCTNATSGNWVGMYNFVNYAIAAIEKRVALLGCQTEGATDSGNLQFFTMNLGALAERVRITAAGNVGIGTASPALPLHLKRDVSGDPANSGTAQAGGLFRLQTFDVGLDFGVYPNACQWIQAYGAFANLASVQHLVIQPRFGNLGVGTGSAPAYKLDVAGGDINVAGNYRKNGTIIPGGLGLTRQVLATQERALGTTYRNTGEEAKLVSVTVTGVGQATARTDDADPPATAVAATAHMLFVVLPGNYYRITVEQDVTLATWVEWT